MNTTTENNKLIAEFMDFSKNEQGRYYVKFKNPNITFGDTKPEHLHFDAHWDWLMPVVGKLSSQSEEPQELDDLRMCLLCNDIEGAYGEVVNLIENL